MVQAPLTGTMRQATALDAQSTDAALRARTFRIATIYAMLAVTLMAAAMSLLEPETASRRVVTILIVFGVCLPLLFLNRMGRTRLASVLMLAVLLLVCVWRISTAGGVHSPTTPGLIALVLLAGLLLGTKAAAATAAAAIAACTLLTILSVSGNLPAAEVPLRPWSTFLFFTAWTLIAVLVLHLFGASLENAQGQTQAELERRRQLQDQLDLALEAAGIGVWELDFDSLRVNADARVLNLYGLAPSSDGIIWADLLERIHPDHRAAVE